MKLFPLKLHFEVKGKTYQIRLYKSFYQLYIAKPRLVYEGAIAIRSLNVTTHVWKKRRVPLKFAKPILGALATFPKKQLLRNRRDGICALIRDALGDRFCWQIQFQLLDQLNLL